MGPAPQQERKFLLAADQRGQPLDAVRLLEPGRQPARRLDSPDANRLRDALERPLSKVGQLESTPEQAPRGRGDDDLVCSRQALQPRGHVGCIAYREFGIRAFLAALPHDHGSGGDADAHLDRRAALYVLDHLHDLEGCMQRALSVILVCQWPAEVGHHAIAQVLGHVALVAGHDFAASLSVGAHELAQLLGIEPLGECGEAHHVAEQHGQLAAFASGSGSGRGAGCKLNCLCAVQFGDRLQELFAMAKRYAEILQVLVAKYAQDVEVDVVVCENLRVLLEVKQFEPTRDGLHLPLPIGLKCLGPTLPSVFCSRQMTRASEATISLRRFLHEETPPS